MKLKIALEICKRTMAMSRTHGGLFVIVTSQRLVIVHHIVTLIYSLQPRIRSLPLNLCLELGNQVFCTIYSSLRVVEAVEACTGI